MARSFLIYREIKRLNGLLLRYDIESSEDETSEDCLYMNIWVPIKHEYDEVFLNESNKMNNDEILFDPT